MELRVESAHGFSLPEGCFVGVRVGDVLKQRRYDPKGCYQFPAPAHRRTAKIDLYRHVGTCTTAVGPDGKSCEVEVKGLDAQAPAMRLKVSTLLRPEALQEREAKMTNVKKDALDYLAKWQIQERLGEAVKMVLQKRPEDPIEFICSLLKAAPPPPEAARPPPAAARPAPQAEPQPAKATPQAPRGFGQYYQDHVVPAGQPLGWLHAKFPGAARPTQPAAQQGAKSFTLMPSVGTWYGRRPKKTAPQQPPQPAAQQGATKYALMPSVGTWQMRKPVKVALLPKQPPTHVKVAWDLQGCCPAPSMGPDERWEVERVLARAFSEFTGALEGEYLPLPGSTSYLPRPGGMSQDEQLCLNAEGFLFQATDPCGRGIFVTAAKDLAIWVNGQQHLQVLVKEEGLGKTEAVNKLRAAEGALRQALRQDGYDYAEPTVIARRLQGINSPQAMSLDERYEVERVLTRSFLELKGVLEGEYFPMRSSVSYPPRPGGMSADEERALMGDGLVFGPSDSNGRGVFVTAAGDLIVVNGEEHLQLVARSRGSPPGEAAGRLRQLEASLQDGLRQSGYAYA